MNILFLDDNKERAEQFLPHSPSARWVKTAKDTINLLEQDLEWDYVFLDHDLGGEYLVDSNREDCGFEVVRWIIRNKPKINSIIIHSWNTVAGKRMLDKLKEVGYNVRYMPFGSFSFGEKLK